MKDQFFEMVDEMVILLWEDECYSAIVDEPRLRFLESFHTARKTAATWGGFLTMLGRNGTSYVSLFTNGDSVIPYPGDSIERLFEEGVWVLIYPEFSIAQCLQEVFDHYGQCFPMRLDSVQIHTEYGCSFRVYPNERIAELRSQLEGNGLTVRTKKPEFPMTIYDYGAHTSNFKMRNKL